MYHHHHHPKSRDLSVASSLIILSLWSIIQHRWNSKYYHSFHFSLSVFFFTLATPLFLFIAVNLSGRFLPLLLILLCVWQCQTNELVCCRLTGCVILVNLVGSFFLWLCPSSLFFAAFYCNKLLDSAGPLSVLFLPNKQTEGLSFFVRICSLSFLITVFLLHGFQYCVLFFCLWGSSINQLILFWQ